MDNHVLKTEQFAKAMEEAFKEDRLEYGDELVNYWFDGHLLAAKQGPVKLLETLSAKRDITTCRILDLGCGWGESVIFLKASGIECYGIDIRDDIAIGAVLAQENGLNPSLIQGDGFRLPFKDDSFDVVHSNYAFEHIEHPEQIILEIARVLKADGLCILTMPNKLFPICTHSFLIGVPYLPHALAERYVRFRKRRARQHDWDVWYHRRSKILSVAREVGFHQVEYYPPNYGVASQVMDFCKERSTKAWAQHLKLLLKLAIPLCKIMTLVNIPISKYFLPHLTLVLSK